MNNVEQKIIELQKQFPLFKFEEYQSEFNIDKIFIKLSYSDAHTTLLDLKDIKNRINDIKEEHWAKEKTIELNNKYPCLNFIVCRWREKIYSDNKIINVQTSNQHSENLGNYSSEENDKFAILNKLSERARQQNKVICSNCKMLHIKTRHVFNDFYCNKCFKNIWWIKRRIKASQQPNFYE